ncbi:MAG: RNA 2',3'-cyclic phosphodiesterase [Candidatus Omnitrophota bacterium]
MRLFFAVLIPPVISRGIAAERENISVPFLRWVAPENQHFTLRFLGEIEEGRVAELILNGRETALKHHSFSLTIFGAGFFPDEERPRVFWVGTGEGSEKLIALAGDLSLGSENHLFFPHLTVARITPRLYPPLQRGRRGGSEKNKFQELESWKNRNFGSFSVNEFCLVESLLLPVWTSRQTSPNLARSGRPTGAVYRKVHSFSLEALDGR